MNVKQDKPIAQDDRDELQARKGRHIAVVIAGTMVLWVVLSLWVGPAFLPGRYAFLFDFAALAALIYAFVNIYQLWRMRQDS
ncbi:DUF5337 domain-containing protein [Falsiphaeobacter marinintestinus]|uniref:DUF5337 domain-containing protein n=1 Tax=Falsiphaeobacter marinintestinus TaxID=1492905 RepID=UPI0011B70A71|nr:DUF5337 domain-containing protein [Phaeobacter marinintestinus]